MNYEKSPLQLLKEVWGYNNFKGNQENIISTILNGKDCLAIMATGSGKSVCYQLPALLLPGVTVVISPLISLMQDQVQQLNAYGVGAVFLSGQDCDEYNSNIEKLATGKAKLVYIAPEGLVTGRLLSALFYSKVEVSLIAVDEAHCVSTWGHDFRTDYLRIPEFKNNFPRAPVVALTATATQQVRSDIIEKLQLRHPVTFVASFNRPNIFLEVRPKIKDGFLQVVDFINNHKNECGIIYCFSKKEVDNLTDFLQKQGFSALPYHAGLGKEIRTKNQDDFTQDKVDIIVATVAFGMGINKSNVRFVVHCDISKSIEQYYQEIGRAGRDGLPAVAHLLYKAADAMKIRAFFDEVSDRRQAERLLNLMCNYAATTLCRRQVILSYFGESYNCTDKNCCCDNCAQGLKDPTDVTIPAQKFMSCILRVGDNFSTPYIVSVLLGSGVKKIIENGHDKLSTFGIGRDYARGVWYELCNSLVAYGYIAIKFNRVLFVTKLGRDAIRNREKILLPIDLDALQKFSKKTKKAIVYSVDENGKKYNKSTLIDNLNPVDKKLYEILRQWRWQTASALSVPPYIIFYDSVLFNIIKSKPKNISDLENISGLGSAKIIKWGEQIIKIVSENI